MRNTAFLLVVLLSSCIVTQSHELISLSDFVTDNFEGDPIIFQNDSLAGNFEDLDWKAKQHKYLKEQLFTFPQSSQVSRQLWGEQAANGVVIIKTPLTKINFVMGNNDPFRETKYALNDGFIDPDDLKNLNPSKRFKAIFIKNKNADWDLLYIIN